ncbi:MAG: CsbD family protein [Candidatus Binatia bacterium]
MNRQRIEGTWDQFKGKVRQQWGKLTDDDIERVRGKRDELLGRLKERYGYERDRAEEELNTWLDSLEKR